MWRTSRACVSGWAGKQSNWQLAISKWPNLIATVCGIIAKQKRTKKQAANFHDNPNRETSSDSVIRKIRGLFCGPLWLIASCHLLIAPYGRNPRSSGSGPAIGVSNSGGTLGGRSPTLSGSIVSAPSLAKNTPIWICGSIAIGLGNEVRNVWGL